MEPPKRQISPLLAACLLFTTTMWVITDIRLGKSEAEVYQLRTDVGALDGRNDELTEEAEKRQAEADAARIAQHEATTRADTLTQRVADLEAEIARLKAPRPSRSAQRTETPSGGPVAVTGRSVRSTAYCLTGTMANGDKAHKMAVAVPEGAYPLNTYVMVSDGPYGGGKYKVADHIGHSSQLDFAMPGDCSGALAWGRRSVTVRAA